MVGNCIIDKHFAKYQKHSANDGYHVKIDDKLICGDVTLFEKDEKVLYKRKKTRNGFFKTVYQKKYVKSLHPNKIDNKKFWVYAKTNFPLISVCRKKTETIEECNISTFDIPLSNNFIEFLNNLIERNKEINFFEIGYGHGNMFYYLKDKAVNYLGIDYYKNEHLAFYDELLTIDKSGIPDIIKDNSQDVIYSCNVLQHCSQKDRFDYLKQAYSKLKTGGFFLGTMFIETDENTDKSCWGHIDYKNRKYTTFFGQLTDVDRLDEFSEYVKSLGFKFVRDKVVEINFYSFILKK